MPSSDAPGNPWHSPSCMASASTTASIARMWPNAAAPSSYISRESSSFVFSSPRSSGGLAPSASGMFAPCDPFGIRRAVNQPLLQSISGFLALSHGKPKTRSYAFIGTTKTSDLSTGLRCPKYWTKRLAFRLSFAAIITWPLRPWEEVNAGLCGSSRFLSSLGDITMLIAPRSISAFTRCMLPHIFHTRTS